MKSIILLLLTCFTLITTAQVYPFADGFQSYTNFSTLGTQGGYASDMSVYQTHGMGNSDKGLLAQMSNFNLKDTTLSPLIGPLTAISQLSFYYRIMNTGAQYPFVPATLRSGDVIQVQIGVQTLNIFNLLFAIDSNNHVVDTAFKKITLNAPTSFATLSGNVKFIVRHLANGNDFFVDIDSLVIKDSVVVPTPIVVTQTIINASCFAQCNGVARLRVTGGTPPYTFNWGSGVTTDTAKGSLCAGTYTVTITDNAAVTATNIITITQPDLLQVTGIITNVGCFGDTTGCISLTVTGGTPLYDFNWSNSSTAEDVCRLVANNYSVTVTDGYNCTATFSGIVNQPDLLSATSTFTNPTTIGDNNGSISITVAGGTAGYLFSIDSGATFSTASTYNSLVADCYPVLVKDTNQCVTPTTNICLTDPTVGIATLSNSSFTVYPNPAANFITLELNDIASAEISVVNTMGQAVLQTKVTEKQVQLDISKLPAGNYVLELKSLNGKASKNISVVR